MSCNILFLPSPLPTKEQASQFSVLYVRDDVEDLSDLFIGTFKPAEGANVLAKLGDAQRHDSSDLQAHLREDPPVKPLLRLLPTLFVPCLFRWFGYNEDRRRRWPDKPCHSAD